MISWNSRTLQDFQDLYEPCFERKCSKYHILVTRGLKQSLNYKIFAKWPNIVPSEQPSLIYSQCHWTWGDATEVFDHCVSGGRTLPLEECSLPIPWAESPSLGHCSLPKHRRSRSWCWLNLKETVNDAVIWQKLFLVTMYRVLHTQSEVSLHFERI